MKTSPDLLESLAACREACDWVREQKHASLEAAWLACERGDWMLWFAAKREIDRKKLVLICCECARLALPHAKSPAALTCIETAEAWTRGGATIEQVREARRNAVAYADAADAAYYAAFAAFAAADAAADAADAYAARKKVLSQCADIVRKHLPELP